MSNNNSGTIYGVVLTGGHSKRMETDKSLLNYHGKTQVEYCYELLSAVCLRVFVSNRQEQSKSSSHQKLPQIHDTYSDIGPLGGILSCMQVHPNVAWLVLACDLPFVDVNALKKLIQQRNPEKIATAYKADAKPHLPEPLCAIYEPHAQNQLLQFFAQGIQCPRKILMNSKVQLVAQDQNFLLDNINNINEYNRAIQTIHTHS